MNVYPEDEFRSEFEKWRDSQSLAASIEYVVGAWDGWQAGAEAERARVRQYCNTYLLAPAITLLLVGLIIFAILIFSNV